MDSATSSCKNPSPFPSKAYALAGFDYSNNVLLCANDTCYTLNNDAWTTVSTTAPEKITDFYSISPNAFNPEQYGKGRMLVVGGYFYTRSIRFMTPSGWTQSKTVLPVDLYFGCVVALNATTFLIVGGNSGSNYYSRTAFYYNVILEKLTEGPERNEMRAAEQCVKIRSSRTHILVVGGFDSSSYRSSTEYLDTETGVWKWGPLMPIGITLGSMQEHPKGGALLIGGVDSNNNVLDTIYHLPSVTGRWVKLPWKLQVPRYRHTTLMIPDSLTTCSD